MSEFEQETKGLQKKTAQQPQQQTDQNIVQPSTHQQKKYSEQIITQQPLHLDDNNTQQTNNQQKDKPSSIHQQDNSTQKQKQIQHHKIDQSKPNIQNKIQSQSHQSQKIILQLEKPVIEIISQEGVNQQTQSVQIKEQIKEQGKQSIKTSRRLAKFRQKQKTIAKKKEQSDIIVIDPSRQQIHEDIPMKNIKSKFIKPLEQNNEINQQLYLNESKMIEVMIQSKKKQNYISLKQWDHHRIEELGLYLRVVGAFDKSLDRVARSSFENVDIYLSTFKSIYNQQLKSADYFGIDIVDLTQKNELSQNVYLTFSCIIDALSEQNMERAIKAKKMAQHINIHIFKNTLNPHILKSQKLINQIKTRISKLKSGMISLDSQIDHTTQKLAQIFSNISGSIQQAKTSQQYFSRDLFESQIQFLKLVSKLYQVYQQYAQIVMEYHQIVKAMETERIEIIKQSIKIYCQALQSIYQSQTAQQSLELLSKPQQNQLFNQFYKLQVFLSLKLQDSIKEKMNIQRKQKIRLEDLLEYFKKELDIRQLILKQYPITSSVSKFPKLSLLITVDKFLHIVNSTQSYDKPIVTFKIDGLLDVKRKGNQLELKKLQQNKGRVLGILGWKHKVTQDMTSITFDNKDKAEEAQDYMRKLL